MAGRASGRGMGIGRGQRFSVSQDSPGRSRSMSGDDSFETAPYPGTSKPSVVQNTSITSTVSKVSTTFNDQDCDDLFGMNVFGGLYGSGSTSAALNEAFNIPRLTDSRGLKRELSHSSLPVKELGTDYATKVRLQEEEKAIPFLVDEGNANLTPIGDQEPSSATPNSHHMEDVSTVADARTMYAPSKFGMTTFVGQDTLGTGEGSLPIEAHRLEILKEINMKKFVIIVGDTGCGKTTMVPWFILRDAVDNNKNFNIVVTQPRRIAAVSVARRVSEQNNLELGQLIGYQIGMNRMSTEKTRLLFCTTGVLLQRLINSRDVDAFTHIIIDEIHERDVDTDLLLMVVRRLIWSKVTKVKVILMSATVSTEKLVNYFKISVKAVPACAIPGHIKMDNVAPRKLHKFTLDHLVTNIDLSLFKKDEPAMLTETIEACIRTIQRAELEELTQKSVANGAILIFLPGLLEIHELYHRLNAINNSSPKAHYWILMLHSSLSDEDQRNVFLRPLRGQRKIILATNIAESSITVPDVSYVFDFCLTKVLEVDRQMGLPTLKLRWASRANLEQRAGRAGRTCDGRVYRLIPNQFYHMLDEYPEPEITRTPLELSVLRTKILDMGSPKDLLALCLDPPNLQDIRKSVLKLKRIGSLFHQDVQFSPPDSTLSPEERKKEKELQMAKSEEDGDLTSLGRIMASLPIDVNLSKLIILGFCSGFCEDTIIMAACMTVQTFFFRGHGPGQELDSYKSLLSWADNSFCDLMAFYNAFIKYQQMDEWITEGKAAPVKGKNKPMDEWLESCFLQKKRIQEVAAMVAELKKRLENLGFSWVSAPNLKIDPIEKELILKVLIAGAFYPNYFIRTPLNHDALKKMEGESSPFNSVTISNLPHDQGVLYSKPILDFLKPCADNMDLYFDNTKCIVTFSGDQEVLQETHARNHYLNRGSEAEEINELVRMRKSAISNAVYLACRMSKIRDKPLTISLLSSTEASKQMRSFQESVDEKRERAHDFRTSRFRVRSTINMDNNSIPPTAFPTIAQFFSEQEIEIVKKVSVGHLFVRYTRSLDGTVDNTMERIKHACYRYEGPSVMDVAGGKVAKGSNVIVIHCEDHPNQHLRGLVTNVDRHRVGVQLIDYGDTCTVDLKDVRIIYSDRCPSDLLLPPNVMEFKVAGIKPSPVANPHESWSPRSEQLFFRMLDGEGGYPKCSRFIIRGVSMVQNVIRGELFGRIQHTQDRTSIDLAVELCDAAVAEAVEESPESVRFQKQGYNMKEEMPDMPLDKLVPSSSVDVSAHEFSVISRINYKKQQTLHGPDSSLSVQYSGMNRINSGKFLYPDGNSVNSITLEPVPASSDQRLMVAGRINISSETKRLRAQITTMMPLIRGFPSLMTLLWSPRVEFRVNQSKTLYTGALCGLGFTNWDGTNHSLDPENDVDLIFDGYINKFDIMKMNMIRYHIDNLLGSGDDGFFINGPALHRKQEAIRQSIITLLQTRRMAIDPPDRVAYQFYLWGQTQENLLPLSPEFYERKLLRLMQPPPIKDYTSIEEVETEIEAVNNFFSENPRAYNYTVGFNGVCPVCFTKVFTRLDWENHRLGDKHRMRINQFRDQLIDIQTMNEKDLLMKAQRDINVRHEQTHRSQVRNPGRGNNGHRFYQQEDEEM